MDARLRLDHVAILVRDLARSAAFYRDVLMLPEIECKVGKSHIRWFGISDRQSIHLIEGDFGNTAVKFSTHFCISTDRFDAMKEHFTRLGVTYCNVAREENRENFRPDGIRQIYIQDPDAYWIEFNDEA